MLVRDCMTHHPIMVPPSMPLSEAQQLMADNKIRHLPVVEDGKRLVGLLTREIGRDGECGVHGPVLHIGTGPEAGLVGWIYCAATRRDKRESSCRIAVEWWHLGMRRIFARCV